MTLAEQLIELIDKNNLDSLDIGVSRYCEDRIGFVSYAQCELGSERLCGQGCKDTPAEAIDAAIAQLNEKRAAASPAPELVAA